MDIGEVLNDAVKEDTPYGTFFHQKKSIEEILVNKIVDAAIERKEAIAANDIHQYDYDVKELTNLIFTYIDLLIEFRDCKEWI